MPDDPTWRSESNLFDLPMVNLDRRTATENAYDHRHATIRFIDLLDFTLEILEITLFDSHPVANTKGYRRLEWLISILIVRLVLLDNLFDVSRIHRSGLAIGTGEITNAGRFPNQKPRVIIDGHVGHQITRVELPLDYAAGAIAGKGNDIFSGNQDLAEALLKSSQLNAFVQRIAYAVLSVERNLDDVPVHARYSTLSRRIGAVFTFTHHTPPRQYKRSRLSVTTDATVISWLGRRTFFKD
jgi:hypothetical protein